ncbi:MAG: N-formylglutamate amidohydrolase [Pirellula sp.]|nr:N-formylglutamate amidohydrolase [Pirellula sp.]
MELFHLTVGEGPLVSAAIHNGHALRGGLLDSIGLTEPERLREEDPYTDMLSDVAPTQIVGNRSRFEVDLNRPRDESVYLTPEQAWGLNVWREPPATAVVEESRQLHDLFYGTVGGLLRQLVESHGRVIVLDVHSYNHRRNGPDGAVADETENPEVNIGTGSMDRELWAPVIDALIAGLRRCEINSRPLDVRENVKFQGGHFPRWIHGEFPGAICAPAIEFKKTFMNEWTGNVDHTHLMKLRDALRATTPQLLEKLKGIGSR